MSEDSAYESDCPVASDAPGELQKKGKFVLHSSFVLVTYVRSNVSDPEEFHRLLLASLTPHLPKAGGPDGGPGIVEIFGSLERHEDGTPHYHVVMKFEPRVHWRNAREKFFVYRDVDGQREVDTESVHIRKKPNKERAEKFLADVQAYVQKDGVVFGKWISAQTSAAAERERRYREILDEPSREKAESLLRTYFARDYIFRYPACSAFLKTKKTPSAMPHEPTYASLPWRHHPVLEKWKRDNFPVSRGGRPQCLVLIGPPRCGKTEWALSFGRPAQMTGHWNFDELQKPDFTHVVLNDIVLRGFPHKRDLAGCQEWITATGKYREERTVKLGKPVIWTCNHDNSPLLDRELKRYMKASGVVVVRIKEKLFESEG
ncbi:hypothetical protein HIM_11773 [Hirsutella minnesotensis 3608]|uniref:CRESS-DNA virus Rep endonuclease domain-containing protein n=1 Tax=Hirsutella minnesotensis 3608 TaxID=1043627 RepID=A0A0F7ZR17_9HYPO|nr:hypothetical protein HIM_11773 [Hirsutella minnesotensis 3608]